MPGPVLNAGRQLLAVRSIDCVLCKCAKMSASIACTACNAFALMNSIMHCLWARHSDHFAHVHSMYLECMMSAFVALIGLGSAVRLQYQLTETELLVLMSCMCRMVQAAMKAQSLGMSV